MTGLRLARRKGELTLGRLMIYALVVWAIVSVAMAFAEESPIESTLAPGTQQQAGTGERTGRWIVINGSNPFMVYDYLDEQNPTLIYFGQKNCPGCKVIEPVIRQVYAETPWLTVVNVRLDELFYNNMLDTLDMMGKLNIRGTPTLLMVREGKVTGFQEGLFKADDQKEALLKFIRGEYRGERLGATSIEPGSAGGSPVNQLAKNVPIALLLGLLAAFSPCSVPMLTAYSSIVSRNRRTLSLGTFAILLGFTGFAGLGLFVVSTLSRRVVGFDVYTLILIYMASFVALWGLYNIRGREPVFRINSKYTVLLPALGLQCSLPFLLTALSLGSRDPYSAVGSAIAFSLGFVLPYAGLSGAIARIISGAKASGRYDALLRMQGAVMLALAAYLYYDAYKLGLF